MAAGLEVTINKSGNILIWDPNCIQFLRQECRIFGKFIGTVARAPHKTTFKGLPLKLGFDELVTLVKERSDKIYLVISSSVISEKVGKVTPDMVTEYKMALDENYKQMSEIINTERERKSNLHFENLEKVTLGKRKSNLISGNNPNPQIDQSNVLVHLPTGSPNEWLRSHEKERINIPPMTTLVDSLQFLTMLFKNNVSHEISAETVVKCVVFHTLWNQGHSITISCKKMGGDYLLYSGDPWVHHATHVARVMGTSVDMKPSEWISSIRLINSLKKSCLIAWYEEKALEEFMERQDLSRIVENLNVTFDSFRWTGRIP